MLAQEIDDPVENTFKSLPPLILRTIKKTGCLYCHRDYNSMYKIWYLVTFKGELLWWHHHKGSKLLRNIIIRKYNKYE